MRSLILIGLTFLLAWRGAAAPVQKAPQPPSQVTKAERDAVALIRRLLDDPMVLPTMHGARLERGGLDREDKWRRPDNEDGPPPPLFSTVQYRIFQKGTPARRPLDSVHIRLLSPTAYDFMIFLIGEGADTGAKPDAKQLAAELDGFAARHWPGVTCVTDRSALFPGHRRYALHEQEAEVFTLLLEYRPDGKVYRISTQDSRPALGERRIPPPPTRERVLAAVREALAASPQSPVLVKMEPVVWGRSVFAPPGAPLGLSIDFNLNGETADGKAYTVIGTFAETTQSAWLQMVRPKEPQRTTGEGEGPSRIERGNAAPVEAPSPVTVADKAPSWSADGKRLFFITSRATATESRWSRKHAVFVETIATCTVRDGAAHDLRALQPLKPFNSDQVVTFDSCVPSSSARYLALSHTDGLFLCDTQKGLTYWPQEVRAWRPSLRRWLPIEEEIAPRAWPRELTLAWLPGERGLLLAGFGGISVVQWTGEAPQQVTRRMVLGGRAEFRLPCLSDGGRSVAFARQELGAEEWQFGVAAWDARAFKLGPARLAQIPAEPKSIAWDPAGRRWLLATDRRGLFWVKVAGKNITITAAPSLKWGEIRLVPNGAAINPVTGLIVVAADIEPGLAYPQKQVRALASLFRWDGRGSAVTPLIQPEVSGLPLGKFSNTMGHKPSPWTTFVGDVEHYRLRDYLDPRLVRSTPQRRPFAHVLATALRLERSRLGDTPRDKQARLTMSHPDNRRQFEALRLILRGDMTGVAGLIEGTPPTADEWEEAIFTLRAGRCHEAAAAMRAVYNLGRVSWRVNDREMLRDGLEAWARVSSSHREPLTRLLLALMRDDFELRHAVAHAALDLGRQAPEPGDELYFAFAVRLNGVIQGQPIFAAIDVFELAQAGKRDHARRLRRALGAPQDGNSPLRGAGYPLRRPGFARPLKVAKAFKVR